MSAAWKQAVISKKDVQKSCEILSWCSPIGASSNLSVRSQQSCWLCWSLPPGGCTSTLTTAKTDFSRTIPAWICSMKSKANTGPTSTSCVLDEIQTGDLLETDTWRSLAIIEATMLNNSDFAPYHYPLFGTQANNGPAGQAMQWMALHDEVSAEAWLPSLQSATAEVLMANDEANLSAALSNLLKPLPTSPRSNRSPPTDFSAGTPKIQPFGFPAWTPARTSRTNWRG